MVHEVPDQKRLFEEMKSVLNPGGRIWVIEPKIQVSGKAFQKMTGLMELAGLKIIEKPGIWLSRCVLLTAED